MRPALRPLALLVLAGALVLACGSTPTPSGSAASAPTPAPTPRFTPTPTPAPTAMAGTITVSLLGLEGVEGLSIDAFVLPVHPHEMYESLGRTHFAGGVDPFSATDVIHPPRAGYITDDEAATFEPGIYRFAVEAYVSNGPMRFGCEMPLEVVDASPVNVSVTSLPVYTNSGFWWTPTAELSYPPCPVPVTIGSVSVTLVGLNGLSGMRLAAFLLPGYPPVGDITDPAGFAIDVDRDPLSRTELLRTPRGRESNADPWPWFSSDLALVPPGTHPLFLWASAELSPHWDYWPGWSGDGDPPEDWHGCAVEVTVHAGQHTEVRVTDIPYYLSDKPRPHGTLDLGALAMPACGVL